MIWATFSRARLSSAFAVCPLICKHSSVDFNRKHRIDYKLDIGREDADQKRRKFTDEVCRTETGSCRCWNILCESFCYLLMCCFLHVGLRSVSALLAMTLATPYLIVRFRPFDRLVRMACKQRMPVHERVRNVRIQLVIPLRFEIAIQLIVEGDPIERSADGLPAICWRFAERIVLEAACT